MDKLYWFYDALVIGIIITMAYLGGKRGLLKSIVFTALVILSFVGSWFVAEAAAPYIYDNYIKDRVVEAFYKSAEDKNPAEIVSQAVSKGDYGVEMTEDEVNDIIGRDSDFFTVLADEMRKNGSPESKDNISTGVENSVTPVIIDGLLDTGVTSVYIRQALDTIGVAADKAKEVVSTFIVGTQEQVASVAEENLVAPAAKWLLKAIIFILAMFVFRLIISPVSNTFRLVNKVPLIGPLNALLGAVLGFVESIVFLSVLALVVKAVVNISGNQLIFLNNETIEMTKLFSKFYDSSILALFSR